MRCKDGSSCLFSENELEELKFHLSPESIEDFLNSNEYKEWKTSVLQNSKFSVGAVMQNEKRSQVKTNRPLILYSPPKWLEAIICFFGNNHTYQQTFKIMNNMKQLGQREALKGVLRTGVLKNFGKLLREATLMKAFSSMFKKDYLNSIKKGLQHGCFQGCFQRVFSVSFLWKSSDLQG